MWTVSILWNPASFMLTLPQKRLKPEPAFPSSYAVTAWTRLITVRPSELIVLGAFTLFSVCMKVKRERGSAYNITPHNFHSAPFCLQPERLIRPQAGRLQQSRLQRVHRSQPPPTHPGCPGRTGLSFVLQQPKNPAACADK